MYGGGGARGGPRGGARRGGARGVDSGEEEGDEDDAATKTAATVRFRRAACGWGRKRKKPLPL
jgi:hypothetical protein